MPQRRRSHLRTCNNRDHYICQDIINLEQDSVQLTSLALKGLVSALQVPESSCQHCRNQGCNRDHGANLQQRTPRLEAVQHARHREIYGHIQSLKVHVAHMTEEITFLSSSIGEVTNLLKSSRISKKDTQDDNQTTIEND